MIPLHMKTFSYTSYRTSCLFSYFSPAYYFWSEELIVFSQRSSKFNGYLTSADKTAMGIEMLIKF